METKVENEIMHKPTLPKIMEEKRECPSSDPLAFGDISSISSSKDAVMKFFLRVL
jgi:hypothetical protein